MKKSLLILALLSVCLCLCACVPNRSNTDYLRIHIRADSNSPADQNVKYVVKDAVVEYLTPYVSACKSKNEAYKAVASHLDGIEKCANAVLRQNGYDYSAHAKLTAENFPPRSYNGLTLEQGIYDALIVELGSGSGDNWWCVVYPPLCFVGGQSNDSGEVKFKSFFVEKFLGK